MDDMHKKGNPPGEILKKLRAARAKRNQTGPSKHAVHRFVKGKSYKRGRSEPRGRPAGLPSRLVAAASAQRHRLIKQAARDPEGPWLVTWADVHKATKKVLKERGALKGGVRMPSEDWLARTVRGKSDLRVRPAKKRIARKVEHEKMRKVRADEWAEHSKSWWVNNIHAYIDNKHFVLPRNSKERRLLRASHVTRHLRTPAEGKQPEFLAPKTNRMLLGIPSLEVTAAVAEDRIIMWHVTEGRWNGEAAAKMYAELGKALRKTWGNKRSFRVMEDGDTKGFQSGKGKQAKENEKIESWMLPPRTPSLMPLDYCLWVEIEKRALKKNDGGQETRSEYAARLRQAALRLPRNIVKNCLGKMRENVLDIVKAKGKSTKLD